MDSNNKSIGRLGLGLIIVVLWIVASMKSFMMLILGGDYIGKSLILYASMSFVYFIYPILFMYSMYSPTDGSYVLKYSVIVYAIIFLLDVILNTLLGPKSRRTKM